MKKLLLSALCAVTAILAGAATEEKSYTITFTTGTETNKDYSEPISNLISEGAEYVSAVSTKTNVKIQTKDGVAVGSNNNAGTLTLTLSEAGKKTVTKYVVKNAMGKSANYTLNVNGIGAKTMTATATDYPFIPAQPTAITEIKIEASKKSYIGSIEVYYNEESGSGEDPEPVKELGDVVATFNGTTIESEGQITIEQGQTIEINADNAAKISAQIGDGIATEVEASTMTWTPTEIVSDEVATIIATAADGTTTKKLEFFITITEKTAVEPDEPAGNPTYTKADWANLDMTAEYIVTATGVDINNSNVQVDYVMTTTAEGTKAIKAESGIVFSNDKNTITTLPAGAAVIAFEATATEGEYLIKIGNSYLKAATSNTLTIVEQKSDAVAAKIVEESIQFPTVINSNKVGSLQLYSVKGTSARFSCYSSNQKPITLYKVTKSGTSSISEVTVEKSGNGMMFDLQGRRVVAPRKGQILIQNGRKVRF